MRVSVIPANLMVKHRIFILSPARTDGKRAALLMNERAEFDLAQRLRHQGVTITEAFSFLSGLYFRGKATYAAQFGKAPDSVLPQYVITSSSGLLGPDTTVNLQMLQEFSKVPIDLTEPGYRKPLEKSIRKLNGKLDERCEVILLGSIATDKYCEPLLQVFGPRLLFPKDFIGRGDMSRGGLLLRAARTNKELEYASLQAIEKRTGARPPRLPRLPG
jgi:hypothetical protein